MAAAQPDRVFINDNETYLVHRDLQNLFKPVIHSLVQRHIMGCLCQTYVHRAVRVLEFVIQVINWGLAQDFLYIYICVCVCLSSPTFSLSLSLCLTRSLHRRWWQCSSCCTGTGHWKHCGKGSVLDRYRPYQRSQFNQERHQFKIGKRRDEVKWYKWDSIWWLDLLRGWKRVSRA